MTKRSLCPECDYIISRCLCSTIRSIDNKTHLIVLQHPTESRHALNTVNLMKKSFLKMDLFIGENFSEMEKLNSLIDHNLETMALIFPTNKSKILTPGTLKKITHLIFIDGTWKKARKIYLLSTNLHKLDHYSLIPTRQSNYKIRSSSLENSLSTLEATVCALDIIEQNLETKSLEESFLKMIEFQIEKMGEEIFRKNYQQIDESNESEE